MQKLVSLIRSHLFSFAFISIAIGDWLKTSLYFMSENVLPVFSSRSYCLIFKTLSPFQFIFVCSVRMCPNFIDLHAPGRLAEETVFSPLYSLAHLSKINWLSTCGFISRLCPVSLIHVSVSPPVLHCSDCSSLEVLSKVWTVKPPALFLFLRVALAVLLWCHINFRIICFSCVKNVLIRIASNL